MEKRRRHTRAFKLSAIARLQGASDVTALASELSVDRGLLYKWKRAFGMGGEAALRFPGQRTAPVFPSAGSRATSAVAGAPGESVSGVAGPSAPGVADLERKVAQQALELDFFRAALQHFAGLRRTSGGSGGTGSTP